MTIFTSNVNPLTERILHRSFPIIGHVSIWNFQKENFQWNGVNSPLDTSSPSITSSNLKKTPDSKIALQNRIELLLGILKRLIGSSSRRKTAGNAGKRRVLWLTRSLVSLLEMWWVKGELFNELLTEWICNEKRSLKNVNHLEFCQLKFYRNPVQWTGSSWNSRFELLKSARVFPIQNLETVYCLVAAESADSLSRLSHPNSDDKKPYTVLGKRSSFENYRRLSARSVYSCPD